MPHRTGGVPVAPIRRASHAARNCWQTSAGSLSGGFAALRQPDSRGTTRVSAKNCRAAPGGVALQPLGWRPAPARELAGLKSVRWEENRSIPRCVAAALASLQYSGDHANWPVCSESEWKIALRYCDRNQLTLLLPRAGLPAEVLRRLDRNSADNQERIRRLKQTFIEIAGALQTPFVVLKGFAGWQQFTPDP